MTIPAEPLYRTLAKRMLDVDTIPESLEYKLMMAEQLVKKCKPGGFLVSYTNYLFYYIDVGIRGIVT